MFLIFARVVLILRLISLKFCIPTAFFISLINVKNSLNSLTWPSLFLFSISGVEVSLSWGLVSGPIETNEYWRHHTASIHFRNLCVCELRINCCGRSAGRKPEASSVICGVISNAITTLRFGNFFVTKRTLGSFVATSATGVKATVGLSWDENTGN